MPINNGTKVKCLKSTFDELEATQEFGVELAVRTKQHQTAVLLAVIDSPRRRIHSTAGVLDENLTKKGAIWPKTQQTNPTWHEQARKVLIKRTQTAWCFDQRRIAASGATGSRVSTKMH